MPSVTSALRSDSGPFSSRSTSLRGCGTSEKCGSPGLGSGLGEPWKKAARMPLSFRPAMPASVCSGVGLLWHQSTSVVTPWSSWFSAPASVAIWMSSGVNTVARPGMHVAEIFQQRPVGGHRAQRRLPGVHVGVDQARQHEVPGCSRRSRPSACSDGAIAAMRSPSTSTSPFGSTPSLASCVTTMPDLRRSFSLPSRPASLLARS